MNSVLLLFSVDFLTQAPAMAKWISIFRHHLLFFVKEIACKYWAAADCWYSFFRLASTFIVKLCDVFFLLVTLCDRFGCAFLALTHHTSSSSSSVGWHVEAGERANKRDSVCVVCPTIIAQWNHLWREGNFLSVYFLTTSCSKLLNDNLNFGLSACRAK